MLGQKAKDQGIENTCSLPQRRVTGLWDDGKLGTRDLAGDDLGLSARLEEIQLPRDHEGGRREPVQVGGDVQLGKTE